MKVVICSKSPVKKEAVLEGFASIFPGNDFLFECVEAKSGVQEQPLSSDETRAGALGRIAHGKELSPGADLYIGLEGGVEEMYGDLYCYGWVLADSGEKTGAGKTFAFMLPPGIRDLIIHKGLEQSHATDVYFAKTGTKTGTGTIGPLTGGAITYKDWYVPAVMAALLPFSKKEFY